ncbi:MAG: hypothetical protein ACOYIS_04245 [Candidatus Cloacimonadaceae bacterium]|jgi:hypothetical protein
MKEPTFFKAMEAFKLYIEETGTMFAPLFQRPFYHCNGYSPLQHRVLIYRLQACLQLYKILLSAQQKRRET